MSLATETVVAVPSPYISATVGASTIDATASYVADVRAGTWPDDEHSFH